MTQQLDRRADTTRLQILHAAAHQFARRPYGLVSLDDILADAEVTKGAMYFHFRSKHALASAIVEHWGEIGRDAVGEILARRLSGLETLIDICYFIAVRDIGDETARAGLNLLESIGRTDGLAARVLAEWVVAFTAFARRAVDEGDIVEERDPQGIARLLVSMYLGLRQTGPLGEPEKYLRDLENMWALVLPGFTKPDRLAYLTQFIRRRTMVATRNAAPLN